MSDLLDDVSRFPVFTYNEESGGSFFPLETWGYQPGDYDLRIMVDAMVLRRARI